jgi:hypothetical protein
MWCRLAVVSDVKEEGKSAPEHRLREVPLPLGRCLAFPHGMVRAEELDCMLESRDGHGSLEQASVVALVSR